MIHVEIEAELGRAGMEELKHHLGLHTTPKLVEDTHSANPWVVIQASDANDEQEEIRVTVVSYLTVRGLSAPATIAIPTQHANDTVFPVCRRKNKSSSYFPRCFTFTLPTHRPLFIAQNCVCTPDVQEQGSRDVVRMV